MPQQATSAPDFSDVDSFVQGQSKGQSKSSGFDDIDSFVAGQAKGAPVAAAATPSPAAPAAPTPSLGEEIWGNLKRAVDPKVLTTPDPHGLPGAFEGKPENIGEWVQEGPLALAAGTSDLARDVGGPPSPEHNPKAALHDLSNVASGVGNTLLPVAPFQAAAAPVTMAAGYGAGLLASKGAGYVAKKFGASDLTKDDIENLAFWAPALVAHVTGFKTQAQVTPEVKSAVVSAFGDRAGVGVTKTPGGVTVGAKVGPYSGTHTFGGPGAPELEPPTIEGTPGAGSAITPQPGPPPPPPATDDPIAQASSAMNAKNDSEVAAARQVQGVPPPAPPPPPPGPPPIHEVTPEMAHNLAQIIQKLPPEVRPQAIMEMHETMAKQLLRQGKVVGPDGKLEVVDSPKAASRIAQQFINDEVERQDKLAEDAAKENDKNKPAAAAPKPAVNPNENPVAMAKALPREPDFSDVHDFVKEAANEGSGQRTSVEGNQPKTAQGDQAGSGSAGEVRPAATATESGAAARKTGREAFTKGDRVQLEDGRKATVSYTSPGDPFVRIKLDGGGQISKGISKLSKLGVESENAADHVVSNSGPSTGSDAASASRGAGASSGNTGEPVQGVGRGAAAGDQGKAGSAVSGVKYKFGNTQANIPEDSEAHRALESARARISPEDLAGQGADVGGNHVTVRYGIKGDDTEKIKSFLSAQAPFEATLGKTEKFPPSEHSDGAAVIKAPIEAPELHRLNSELEQHGEFTEPSFKDYKPHATIAYVKPEKADRYTGMTITHGKKFTVSEIAISKKDGSKEVVKLQGKPKADWEKREDKIEADVKASKIAGAKHVDQLPYGVEAMRGVHFKSLRDGSGGTITTVDNRDFVHYQTDDGKDDIVPRKETAEWVVDGHRDITRDHKNEQWKVGKEAPAPPASVQDAFDRLPRGGGAKSDIQGHSETSKPAAPEFIASWGPAKGEPTERFIDSAWSRFSEGKHLLFSGKKGTLESRLQEAHDAGNVKSRDDVDRIVKAWGTSRGTTPESASRAEAQSRWDVPEHFRPVAKDLSELEKKYDALGTPNYVAGDKAKELLPQWANKEKRGTLEAAVHPDASKVGYQLFRRKLAKVEPGQSVLLVTGPVAAGKTTASMEARKKAALTYEVNLSNLAGAEDHIDAILAQGAKPEILYVHIPPALSAERRALRATKDGRPVNIERSIGQHTELPKTLAALRAKYGSRLHIDVVDNSGTKSKNIPVEKLSSLAYTGSRHELLAEQQSALDKLHASGEISGDLHQQLSNKTAVSRNSGSGDGGVGRSGREGGSGEGPTASLIDAIQAKLEAGESLGNVTALNKLAEEHLGATRTSGKWTPKDVFDAMEAAVNRHLLKRGKALMEMPADEGLKELRTLMSQITSQGVRTDEQLKNQQFSTPPTESYVAAKAAALKPTDVVLEPSAGNGGLAVWPKAMGVEVHVNEISERRQEMLQAAGFGKPTAHDGEIINSLLDPKIKPTVILMNPPFSASTQKSFEAKNTSQYGFNHVDSALQRLEDNGRLVAILGGGQANEPNGGASLTGGAAAKWFERIADKYNVRANIRVDGKEYQKYGTSFATRLIVIDKDGPTPSRVAVGKIKSWSSVKQASVKTLEEAYNALKDVAESRPEVAGGQQTQPRTGVESGGGAGTASDRVSLRRGGEAAAGDELSGRSDRSVGSAGGDQAGAGSRGTGVREPEVPAGQHPETETARRAESRSDNVDRERSLSGTETGDAALSLGRDKSLPVKEEDDASAYVAYRPTLKGPKHPADIVETRTMATVPLPEITYKPSLPESVITDSKLSAVQLEAISIAGQQNDILLPDGSRATALIGDGTGVGKGRIGAGVLWDNWRKGRRRLVWVSEKWDLMQDAMRDLKGIGAHDLAKTIKPFGKITAATPIDHEGILFTTYALIRSEDKKGNSRVNQLQSWLKGKDEAEGGYILYDESHNLKNAVAANAQQVSQIGAAVKKMMLDTPKLRSVSLSATAATDVINLGYLDRLGLWGPGTPFPNGFGEFQAQIASGGMSAMEMVARELKAQGKYVSRTLSYKGVTYEEVEHVLTEDQKDLYRTASKAWAAVVQQAEDTIKNTTNGGAQAKARFMSLFYGAQLRFFNVLLTTLKIPTAVEEATKALAAGKSVVITLVNTNEAAQNREKNRDRGGEDADEVPDYDFGPGEMLKDLVREHYPIQQFVDDVDSEGHPIKVPAYSTDSEGRKIPLINPQATKERDRLIAQLDRDLKMPANPLDILINSLGGPKKAAELTGRKERYDESSGKFVPRGDPNVKRDEINLSEMRAFQGGKKRVAILSSAAGTGISLHAGYDAANQEKRTHITLQPGWSADKAMQMMGRTHRSNEVHPPEYKTITSDLGGEKRFSSTLAKRMGSLGALSKGQSNANAGADLMEKVNFESDQGRQATTAFYNAMLRDVKIPGTSLTGMQVLHDLRVLKPAVGGGGMTVPPADRTNVTRLLNRLLALDPDVQNSVYNYFYDVFQATVQQAIEDGTLDTGVKTLPGDEFEVKEERAISKEPKTGAETYYYPVDAQVRTNRMSVKALEKALKGNAKRGATIMRNKDGKLSLVMEASPIVHASGSITPASYVVSPENGNAKKVATGSLHQLQPVEEWAQTAKDKAETDVDRAASHAEYVLRNYKDDSRPWARTNVKDAEAVLDKATAELEEAQKAAADAPAWAREQWEKQYTEAPAHTTKEHHLIGGAVLRWWNPIREASEGLKIYTAVDSKTGKRVVGVDIPPGEIKGLLARITGGSSTVDASQLHTDVLKNGLSYTLEQGIQVKRGRVNRQPVVQFIPPNQNVANSLKAMGLIYERGVQPVYYLPNAEGFQERDRVADILAKILKEYPVKQEAQKPEGLLSGESGELDISKLGEQVKNFVEQDVAPALEKAGVGMRDVAALGVKALYPRIEQSNPIGRLLKTAAPSDAVDALMKVQGDRAKNLAEFDLILKGVEKMFDRLPEEERVEFVDRIQTGTEQPTPDLKELGEMFKKIMDGQREAEEDAINLSRPHEITASKKSPIELARKENYFHNWWETRPGKEPSEDESERISRLFMPKRPLEGSKGYNKRQSYTLKTGMEAGGEPVTTNPVRILRHRLEDGMKWVTAQRAWYEAGQLDLKTFVKSGSRPPAGFDKIDDKIARVYFPAESGEGVIKAGEWHVEANTARLLNNMLSVDRIRGNALGRGLMWLKNASTAIELGWSPFHAVFESIEAMSSMMSLGLQRSYNQGIRQGDPEALARGIMEMVTSGAAPITLAREGAALPAYIEARARLGKIGLTEYGHVISGDQPHGVLEAIEQFREVRREKAIERLLKRYPDLDQLIDDMFQGGLVVGQHRDYQVKALGKTMTEAWTANNPLGAVWRAIPTVAQGVMYPLFNVYIPNLKYSLFLRTMSEQVSEHSRELEDGSLTRATLARRVADSVENRFGELNFDTLFLNRSMKTALQFAFRSATYKMGTAREMAGALGGQSRELAVWAHDAYQLLGGDGGGGKGTGTGGTSAGAGADEGPQGKTLGEKLLPRLDMRMSWIMSLLLTATILGLVAGRLLSKKWAWQWLEEDHDLPGGTLRHLYLETVHPRTGETDSRGKPVRVSLPTYLKEIEHATTEPGRYVLGSLSSILSRGLDLAENRDFFDNYVYNPHAKFGTKVKQGAEYMAPVPFVASSFERGKQQGLTTTAWLSAFGFPKAPSDLDFTPAEKLARSLVKHQPETPEELADWRSRREALENGTASREDVKKYLRTQRLTWLQRQVKGMGYGDALDVFDVANPEERGELTHILETKRKNALKSGKGAEVEELESEHSR